MNRLNVVELFAGAGGLALGLEASGFATRALVERDRYCCETLRQNAVRHFPSATIIRRDIRYISAPDVLRRVGLRKSDIDLVSGGPPCQSFSISKIPKGGRLGGDPRDALLSHFVRLVRMIRPRAFVFENVPGLQSKLEGKLFRSFLRSLRRLGYFLNAGILNAANYGVPQSRRRLILIGSMSGRVEFPVATHGPPGNEASLPAYVTIAEVLSNLRNDLPNQRIPNTTESKRRSIERIVPGSEWRHWRHRDKWDGPSRCITAHCRSDWIHPLEPRTATVRELASLQCFPEDYLFCGPFNGPNDAKYVFQYRQVGNAVPVLMAKAIGNVLLDHLEE